jgi:hypothetical protein
MDALWIYACSWVFFGFMIVVKTKSKSRGLNLTFLSRKTKKKFVELSGAGNEAKTIQVATVSLKSFISLCSYNK